MTGLHLPPQWRERLLAVTSAKLNVENMLLLDAWQRAEGGLAQWNPLNTTYFLTGSWPYNSNIPPVQNYKRATEGVCATALTLVNGFYGGILGDMQGGSKTAVSIVNDRAGEFRLWGTNPAVILSLL